MTTSVIGALRVVLGLDAADFENGLTAAKKELRQTGREFSKVGRQIGDVGKNLSTFVTLPILGLGAAVTKTAADFESAMNRVSISTSATGDQLNALSDEARKIGRETVFSASTAADAMDMLAKAGVSVQDILGGAARAAVDLAAAAGTELDPAAAAITDTMAQFKKTTAQLPQVVNQITGAVNESKLDFVDFQMAMGQAGGVAANLGVSFEDFNAVLAGTSPLFSSGSDAGTSFKTFLQRLVPTTEGAATAIEELGLSFHDASGNLRPMREIAEQLRQKLSGLSDQAKTQYLTQIFGTDAMRTAIGLMDQGAAGLDKITEKIAATDAADQAAKRMSGFNGQLEQMKGAFEELAIVIGKSGFLDMVTGIVAGITGLAEQLASVDPGLVRIGLVVAGVAAAFGPVLVAVGAMVSAWGTLATALGGGGILAGVGATLGGLVPLILPVAVGVGAVVAAFLLLRDQVEPALQRLWGTLQQTLGPALGDLFSTVVNLVRGMFGAWMEFFDGPIGVAIGTFVAEVVELLGTVLIRTLTALVRVVSGTLSNIGSMFSILGDLLTGDFAGAWATAQGAVANTIRMLAGVIEAFAPGALSSIQKLVEGVRTWLTGKLAEVFDGVIRRVRQVSDAFFKLYDAVVGHSYVPDLVVETGQWFAKLQTLMVDPTSRATEATADRFKRMRDELRGVLQGLMTDQERAALEMENRMRVLRENLSAGRLGQSDYDRQVGRARAAYNEQRFERVEGLGPGPTITPLTTAQDLLEALGVDRIKQEIASMRDDFGDAFSRGMESALRGDWKSLLQITLGDAFRTSLQGLGKSLWDWLDLGQSGVKKGGGLGNIAAAVGSFFSKLPRFASGGSILPGGSGGTDSQLVAFWKSPHERVDVGAPGYGSGGGRPYFDLRGAVLTRDLVAQMNAIGETSRSRAYSQSMTDAPRLTASQGARSERYRAGKRGR